MTRSSERTHLPHSDDPAFQRLELRLQRAGWVVLAVLIAVAVSGLLGNGPLSKATAASADGSVRIEFERFLHAHKETDVTIEVDVSRGANDRLHLALDAGWLDAMTIRQITPLPVVQRPGAGECVFLFDTVDARAGTPLRITLHAEPETCGPLTAALRINGGDPIHFSQFVYP